MHQPNIISPYLVIPNVIRAVNFYIKVFQAREIFRLEHDSIIYHIELLIGETPIMLSDSSITDVLENIIIETNNSNHADLTLGLYVENVDETTSLAEKMGALIVVPPQNQFWGDRMSTIIDPFGIKWGIATKTKDLTHAEIKKRFESMVKSTMNAK